MVYIIEPLSDFCWEYLQLIRNFAIEQKKYRKMSEIFNNSTLLYGRSNVTWASFLM